jgi:hypothetical protein
MSTASDAYNLTLVAFDEWNSKIENDIRIAASHGFTSIDVRIPTMDKNKEDFQYKRMEHFYNKGYTCMLLQKGKTFDYCISWDSPNPVTIDASETTKKRKLNIDNAQNEIAPPKYSE